MGRQSNAKITSRGMNHAIRFDCRWAREGLGYSETLNRSTANGHDGYFMKEIFLPSVSYSCIFIRTKRFSALRGGYLLRREFRVSL